MFAFIESILPTFMAILALALFTKQTRKLCYATVSLSILAELIPLSINPMALFACSACLVAMIVVDLLQSFDVMHLSTTAAKTE